MKRRCQIILNDASHRRLKGLAGLKGVTIGEAIEALMDIHEMGGHCDKEFRDRFTDLAEVAFLNSGDAGGWSEEDGFSMKNKAAEIREKDQETTK